MSSTTYLITGANRGIGLGLVQTFVKRDNTTVIATVREAAKSARALEALPGGKGSKTIVVEVSSTDHTSPRKAIEVLKTKHGIDHLDVRSSPPPSQTPGSARRS